MPLFEPAKATFGELLKRDLVVPEWQRNYSWSFEHWNDFWNDLLSYASAVPARKYADDPYFVGTVILVDSKRNASVAILDGQQRIATSLILVCAVRDYLRGLAANDCLRVAERLHETYVDKYNIFHSESGGYNLTLNRYDRDYFRQIVQENQDPSKITQRQESHKLILRSALYFRSKVEQILDAAEDPPRKLRKAEHLLEALTDGFMALTVRLDDDIRATHVFEVVNDRGTSLAQEDLVRTSLLQRASASEVDHIVSVWQELFELYNESRFKHFLRHYWISHYGDVKAKSLAQTIRTALEAENVKSRAFCDKLRSSAATYREILSLDSLKDRKDADLELIRCLKQINSLGAITLYPALLSVFERFRTSEHRVPYARRLLKAYVAHNIIAQRDTTLLEVAVYRVAQKLRKSALSPDQLDAELISVTPDNATLRDSFCTLSAKTQVASFLLRAIESEMSGRFEEEFSERIRLHVDHIQAKMADSQWKGHEVLLNRLGNLTLLGGKANRSAGSKSFREKRQAYGQSRLAISKDLRTLTKWTPAEMEARQRALATVAIRIWGTGAELRDQPHPARRRAKKIRNAKRPIRTPARRSVGPKI